MEPAGGRYLIVVGAAQFDDAPTWPALTRVPDELDRVVRFFTSPAQGYTRVLAEQLPLNVDTATIRQAVTEWFAAAERRSSDCVVIYVTGHGHQADRFGNHYLITRSSRADNLAGTAIRTSELAEWLLEGSNERPENLLVLLDVCQAGQGGGQITAITGPAKADVFRADRAAGLHVLGSARAVDLAAEGRFVDAFLAAVDNPAYGGRSQPFLVPDHLIEAINDWFEQEGEPQRADRDVAGQHGPVQFIRNPRYSEGLAGQPLADESHWEPKARGVESLTEAGWYFTGREQALVELVQYLTSETPPERAVLVTGRPGSGKSAVLARLVTCANPATFRQMEASGTLEGVSKGAIAPVGSVDVAIHARQLTVDDIAAQLAVAIQVTDSTVDAVLTKLRDRQQPLRIVLDALDEATRADEIDLKLLQPLAQLPKVRLVVGSRQPERGNPPLGSYARVLDLDEPTYFRADDLVGYIVERLRRSDPPSAYTAADDHVVRAVANRVAQQADRSFLYARTVSRALADAPDPLTPDHPSFQLPADLSEAFTQDLKRFPEYRRRAIVDLLTPLAYGRGRGLPWQRVWPTLASAIADTPYTSYDIQELLATAGYYVVEDQEHGVSVYRLFHETFAQYLRDRSHPQDVDRTIATTLISLATPAGAGRADWRSEQLGYLFAHLPAHAAADPAILLRLVDDPTYLVRANPTAVLDALQRVRKRGHAELALIHRVLRLAHYRLQRHADAGERGSYLQLAARQLGEDDLADRLGAALECPWTTLWAHWLPDLSLTLGRHEPGFFAEVRALVTATLDGRPVVVSGSENRTVRHWDLAAGAEWQPSLRHPQSDESEGFLAPIAGLAAVELEDRTIIVAGDEAGVVRRWDLATGFPYGPPIQLPDFWSVSAIAVDDHGEQPVIIIAHANELRRFRLQDGEQIGGLRTLADDDWIESLAVTRGPPPLLLAGLRNGEIDVLDLHTLEKSGSSLVGHLEWVKSLVTTTLNGSPIAISAGGTPADTTIRVWNLYRREQLLVIATGEGAIRAIALSELDESPVVVSAGDDIRIWNLVDGSPRGRLRGHEGHVSALSTTRLEEGIPVLVSGGYDATVRRWDLADASLAAPEADPFGAISAITVGEFEGSQLAVSARGLSRLELWDLETGRPLHTLAGPTDSSWLYGLALVDASDAPTLVVGSSAGPIYRVDLAQRRLLQPPLPGHDAVRGGGGTLVEDLTVVEVDGVQVVVSTGGQDWTVRRCNLADGRPIGEPTRFEPQLFALASVPLAGRPALLAATYNQIYAWDANRVLDESGLGQPRILDTPEQVTSLKTISATVRDDQSYVLAGGYDREIWILDPGGRLIHTIELDTWVNGLAGAADGIFMVAGNKGVLAVRLAHQP